MHESKNACGYANVTINGQTLPAAGSGSLMADQDRSFIASWNFTCVRWNDEPQEQLMSFNINYVNGQPVEDVGFTIRFQQVTPIWISDIEGSASMTRVHKIGEFKSDFAKDEMDRDLDSELAELDFLRMQLAELEQRIFMKENQLREVFGWSDKANGIAKCDNLKCIMKALYRKMSGAAMSFYGDFDVFDDEPGHAQWNRPHRKPKCHGPGNHTHGNHTFPRPPWHPPHHKKPGFPHPPPFCKCPPPPPPPHHKPHYPEDHPHGPPHGPPHDHFPPPPPPHEGPDHEFPPEFPPDFEHRPGHHGDHGDHGDHMVRA